VRIELWWSLAFSVDTCVARRSLQNKKAPASSPSGHDYRQPKVEEGADAFWQVR
jgi:hypothetical protein